MDLDPTTLGVIVTGAVTGATTLTAGIGHMLRKRGDAAAKTAAAEETRAEAEGVAEAARFRDSETVSAALHASLRMADRAREDWQAAVTSYHDCQRERERDREVRQRERDEDAERCREDTARAVADAEARWIASMRSEVRGEVRRTLSPGATPATREDGER